VQGARNRVTHSTYALGFRVTEEMRDDDQHGIIRQMSNDLADSARDHQERLAFEPLNTAFVNTTFATPDGVALCSAAHVELKTGATASNTLVPGVALSHAGMETMLTQIELTQNDQGRPIKLTPWKLCVHPQDRYEAERLMETEKETGTSENQISTVSKSRTGLDLFVGRYFTDVDNWFILSREHKITWLNRKKLAHDANMDAQTKDQLHDARYRASVCVKDWFGTNGSQV
jgi:hypothetical protein